MLAFLWLLWRLLHITHGAPPARPRRSEEITAAMTGVSAPSFHRLPVFLHASSPLVPRELFRPATYGGHLPAGLAELLVPKQRQHQSVPDTLARAVEARCGADNVSVRVDLFLLHVWSVPSLFRIGSCTPSAVTVRHLFFQYGMLECGGRVQVVGGQLVYSYQLTYTPPSQDQVIRVSPFNLPIHCYYNRFHYSYKVGFRPQIQHTTFLKRMKSKLTFSLTVCNAQWEPLSPDHMFYLGEQVHFLVQAGPLLVGERLYVDSCHATSSEDPSSLPKLDIITNYGCMTDSRREGSSSQFLSGGGNVVKFSVDAFLFRGVSQVQYLHCTVSVGLRTSNIGKSCNFNEAAGRWEEVTASTSVCSCCDSVCTDTDASVKNHVRSSGWLVEQNLEEKPTPRLRSFKAEEREELDQKVSHEDDAESTDSHTFPQHKSDFKDEEPVSGTRDWRKVEVQEQKKAEERQSEKEVKEMKNEDNELKTLLTHIMSDEARPDNETGLVEEKGSNFRNAVSGLSNDYKTSDTSGSGSKGNDSFGIEYNPRTQGSTSDGSSALDSIATLCPQSDHVGCLAVPSVSQAEKDNYNAGHGTIYGAASTETLSSVDISNGSVTFSEKGKSELDSKQVQCQNKSAISSTAHRPVRATVTGSVEGFGGDVDLKVRVLQMGQTHPDWLRDLICNDRGSSLTSGSPGQSFQSLLISEGKLNKKDSGTRAPPIFGYLRSEKSHEHSPVHPALATVTTSSQDSKNRRLGDRRWVEMVPEWVVQHLAFLVKSTRVEQD